MGESELTDLHDNAIHSQSEGERQSAGHKACQQKTQIQLSGGHVRCRAATVYVNITQRMRQQSHGYGKPTPESTTKPRTTTARLNQWSGGKPAKSRVVLESGA